MPSRKRWAFFLAYIRGETGEAGTGDDVSREVGRTDSVRPYLSGDRGVGGPLDMAKLGLVGAEATMLYNLRRMLRVPRWYLAPGRVGNVTSAIFREQPSKTKSDVRSPEHRFLLLCCGRLVTDCYRGPPPLGTAEKLKN